MIKCGFYKIINDPNGHPNVMATQTIRATSCLSFEWAKEWVKSDGEMVSKRSQSLIEFHLHRRP